MKIKTIRQVILDELKVREIKEYKLAELVTGKRHNGIYQWLMGNTDSITTSNVDKIIDFLGIEFKVNCGKVKK